MKPHFFILSFILGMTVNSLSAQQEQTTEQLYLSNSNHFDEANVDRAVSENPEDPSEMNYRDATAVLIRSGSSYTATDVNLKSEGDGPVAGIALEDGQSFNLGGAWNTVTVSSTGSFAYGIHSDGATEVSTISNTEINASGVGTVYGLNTRYGDVVLDNVNFNVDLESTTTSPAAYAISATGSTVSNAGQDQVTITVHSDGASNGGANLASSGAILALIGSTVDLHNTTITVTNTCSSAAAYPNNMYGVLTSRQSEITLTKSSIASSDGNVLVSDGNATAGTTSFVNLDNVDLTAAKNQVVTYLETLELALSNGTDFDGHTQQIIDGKGSLNLDIISGSSWHVTQSSTLGVTGSLTLDGTSAILFDYIGPDLFAEITSPLISLEEGAKLMLGLDSESLQAMLDAHGGIYDVKLFETINVYTNIGVILVTSDGRVLEYTPDDLGTYTLTGILIPEPTTGALWLASFGLFALRRMKN